MATTIIGKQNVLTYTWSVTAGVGTLVIQNNTLFDLGLTDIVRIEDTTQNSTFGISATTTFASGKASGLPTYTWTFTNLPAGTLTADVLLVYIRITYQQAQSLFLQYSASKV